MDLTINLHCVIFQKLDSIVVVIGRRSNIFYGYSVYTLYRRCKVLYCILSENYFVENLQSQPVSCLNYVMTLKMSCVFRIC